MSRNTLIKVLTSIVALSFVMFAGCAGGNNPAPAAPKSPADGRGTMSARIDGQTWTAASVSTLTYKNGTLSIGGAERSNSPRVLGFAVQATKVGTYQIGSPASAILTTGSSAWQASIVGGSGTVTITSLTTTGASGTFSFNMTPTPNTPAKGNKAITEGVFNVIFPSPIVISTPPPAPKGAAAITAQVNGEAWSGSLGPPATYKNQFFSITSFDAKAGAITLGIGQVTGPGTYSLAYGNTNGSSAIFANSAGQGWNTFLPGGNGSITIAALTQTRASGTFSFDAVPATGGATGTIHVNGQFDVALQ